MLRDTLDRLTRTDEAARRASSLPFFTISRHFSVGHSNHVIEVGATNGLSSVVRVQVLIHQLPDLGLTNWIHAGLAPGGKYHPLRERHTLCAVHGGEQKSLLREGRVRDAGEHFAHFRPQGILQRGKDERIEHLQEVRAVARQNTPDSIALLVTFSFTCDAS